jgi:hypothetical protein
MHCCSSKSGTCMLVSAITSQFVVKNYNHDNNLQSNLFGILFICNKHSLIIKTSKLRSGMLSERDLVLCLVLKNIFYYLIVFFILLFFVIGKIFKKSLANPASFPVSRNLLHPLPFTREQHYQYSLW